MLPVSIPPPRTVSKFFEPVVMLIKSALLAWNSVAVVNPIGTSLLAERHDTRVRCTMEMMGIFQVSSGYAVNTVGEE